MKSKLFDAAMSDLLVVPESLPGQDTLNTYFLDVAAAVRSIVRKPDTIRELATRILQMVPPQYTKVFLVYYMSIEIYSSIWMCVIIVPN